MRKLVLLLQLIPHYLLDKEQSAYLYKNANLIKKSYCKVSRNGIKGRVHNKSRDSQIQWQVHSNK